MSTATIVTPNVHAALKAQADSQRAVTCWKVLWRQWHRMVTTSIDRDGLSDLCESMRDGQQHIIPAHLQTEAKAYGELLIAEGKIRDFRDELNRRKGKLTGPECRMFKVALGIPIPKEDEWLYE